MVRTLILSPPLRKAVIMRIAALFLFPKVFYQVNKRRKNVS